MVGILAAPGCDGPSGIVTGPLRQAGHGLHHAGGETGIIWQGDVVVPALAWVGDGADCEDDFEKIHQVFRSDLLEA
jgi:hypothetical protein